MAAGSLGERLACRAKQALADPCLVGTSSSREKSRTSPGLTPVFQGASALASIRVPSKRGAKLHHAHLEEADLSEADPSGAFLDEAYLNGANLSGARLNGANSSRTDLGSVNLEEAEVKAEPLAQAKTLKGATMPDGTIHQLSTPATRRTRILVAARNRAAAANAAQFPVHLPSRDGSRFDRRVPITAAHPLVLRRGPGWEGPSGVFGDQSYSYLVPAGARTTGMDLVSQPSGPPFVLV